MSEAAPSLAPGIVTPADAADQIALQRLVWAYCHGIDRRDFALVRTLYHDDAIDDHGPMFCGGPDAFVAWLPTVMAAWALTAHIIHQPLFLIEGDTAEGELVMTAFHRSADGDRDIVAHGRYLDRYRKHDGIWRFQHRSLVLDWLEEREVVRQDEPSLSDGVEGGRPSAADPCYARLALFGTQRLRRENGVN